MHDPSDLDFLLEENEMRVSARPARLISDFIEGRRIMPQGTPSPGPWSNKKTPYLVSPMDDFSPWSIVQEEAIMKGCQLGFSAASENIIGFWIDQSPTAILFISATQESLEEWARKRVEPMIDSLNLRKKMVRQDEAKSRRSADKSLSKEFAGGSLRMVSAQSAASLRSTSQRLIIKDELDGAPAQLKTGEGNFSDVADARASAFGARKKILNFSTPTTFEESLIWQKYQKGNQMKFLVECVHCHQPQELELTGEEVPWGLKGKFNADKQLVCAVYVCKFCKGEMYDHNKTELLLSGEWVATRKTDDPKYISRHISSLYSPEGWLTWTELYQKYLIAMEEGPKGMRGFTNLYLGLPYRETGVRPKVENVKANRGIYEEGTIPGHWDDHHWTGPLFLSAGIDMQEGSEKREDGTLKHPENPPRLEMLIMGTGMGFKYWSITYKVFTGEVTDAFSGAWQKMYEWAGNAWEGMTFKSAEGLRFFPQLIFIDSGDGKNVEPVYRYASRWQRTFPCKGMPQIVADPERREMGMPGTEMMPYRFSKTGRGVNLYSVNTQFYKRGIYTALGIPRRLDQGEQRNGFCDFAKNYKDIDFDEYCKQLVSEEQRVDGAFVKSYTRNEVLDCTVYATAASHAFLDLETEHLKEWGIKNGATPEMSKQVTMKETLLWMEANLYNLAQKISPHGTHTVGPGN